ncbi:hypothetical protein ACF1BN_15925 [Streptomyces sp. NPDC014861]|uniref:hypothetical protein n=1 Tax=Streptomyces sp. NPDC014861 TaxID=3364923 RepID=UPI0036FC1B0F
MTDRRALAFNSLSRALRAAGHWVPLSARRTASDAVLDAVDADSRTAEHCGHQPPPRIGSRPTECVLRPGHCGSHANHDGMRWWRCELTQGPAAPPRHTADSITSDALDALYAERDQAREAVGKAEWQRDRLAQFLISACRAAGAATYADLPETVRALATEAAATRPGGTPS